MDIAHVRAALADAARAAAGDTGLTCLGYVPDAVTGPCFFAGEVAIDYTSEANTFGHGVNDLEVTCRILVPRADDKTGQALLDAFLSGGHRNSLRDALEADPTLAGECEDVSVQRVQGYGPYDIGAAKYVGAELVVRVLGDGT